MVWNLRWHPLLELHSQPWFTQARPLLHRHASLCTLLFLFCNSWWIHLYCYWLLLLLPNLVCCCHQLLRVPISFHRAFRQLQWTHLAGFWANLFFESWGQPFQSDGQKVHNSPGLLSTSFARTCPCSDFHWWRCDALVVLAQIWIVSTGIGFQGQSVKEISLADHRRSCRTQLDLWLACASLALLQLDGCCWSDSSILVRLDFLSFFVFLSSHLNSVVKICSTSLICVQLFQSYLIFII